MGTFMWERPQTKNCCFGGFGTITKRLQNTCSFCVALSLSSYGCTKSWIFLSIAPRRSCTVNRCIKLFWKMKCFKRLRQRPTSCMPLLPHIDRSFNLSFDPYSSCVSQNFFLNSEIRTRPRDSNNVLIEY